MSHLARTQPTYVLDTSRAGLWRRRQPMRQFPCMTAWLAQDYDPLDTIDRISVYRRRGCEK
ncbi:MAG TPA: hypothetical protein VMW52_10625 [Phycisphaerae bacterium]|nr:hypothetical protein [Phycisphaerae bacterium]